MPALFGSGDRRDDDSLGAKFNASSAVRSSLRRATTSAPSSPM